MNWNDYAKRVLKSEMVLRRVTSKDLVKLLEEVGIVETKSSIDSKISRGTFSAAFFLQSLNVMGCSKLTIQPLTIPVTQTPIAQTPIAQIPMARVAESENSYTS